MGYIGNRPTAVPLTSADIQDGVITAADLGANSVDSSELVDNSVTLAKMAGLARGKLIYGDASGDPAALAVGAANEVLTHDGTDFDWAAASGGANTPAFSAYRTASQTIAGGANVIIGYDTELFDSDSAYDTSTFKFTPQTAGKYFISGSLTWNENNALDYYNELKMYKNGTGGTQYCRFAFTHGAYNSYSGARLTAIVDLNGSSDYVQMGIYNYHASSKNTLYGLSWMQFMGHKLIGA